MSCVLSNNQKCPKKPTFFFTSASSPSTAATISPHTASVGETMKSMKPGWYIFWFICCIFCIFLSFHLLASLGGTMTSMQPRWYCVYLLYLLYLFVGKCLRHNEVKDAWKIFYQSNASFVPVKIMNIDTAKRWELFQEKGECRFLSRYDIKLYSNQLGIFSAYQKLIALSIKDDRISICNVQCIHF